MCPSQLVSQTLNKNYKDTQPHHRHNHSRQQGHYKKTKDNNPKKPGCRQMLASTIHMSNTPPTNPRTDTTTGTDQGKEAQNKQTHPTTAGPRA